MQYMECGFNKIRNKDEDRMKIENHKISRSYQFQYLGFDYSK